MTTIATLTVDLIAKSAKFNDDLKKASGRAKTWSKSVRGSVNAAGKAFTGMSLAAGTALAGLYLSAAKTGDQLAKTADKLGIATEALAGLRHAAELNGVAQTALDVGIQRMTRRLSESEKSTGVAVKSLRELGISMDELKGKSPDEQFKRIADSFQQIESQSDRVRLAFSLFDTEGVALVNVMRGGAEAIAAAQDEAARLGIALNRVDTAKFELANDSFTRGAAVLQGLGNKIAVQLAPFVLALSEGFRNSSDAAGVMGVSISDVIDNGIEAVGYFLNVIRGLELAWAGAELGAAKFVQGVVTGLAGADRLLVTLLNRIPGVNETVYQGLQDLERSVDATVKDLSGALDEVAAKGLPKTAFVAAAKAAQVEANKAAEQLAAASAARLAANGGLTGEELASKARHDKEVAAVEAKNQAIVASNLIADNHFAAAEAIKYASLQVSIEQEKQAMLDKGFALEEIDQQFKDRAILAEEQYLKKLEVARGKEDKGIAKKLAYEKKTSTEKTKHVLGSLQTLTAGSAAESKKMFKLNKAAGIANAVVNTYTGVSQSLAAYPMPLAAVMAAAHLAAGLAQVKSIRSQSFEGGGSSGGSSISSPSVSATSGGADNTLSSTPDALSEINSEKEQASGLTIVVQGDLVGNDSEKIFEELTEIINERDHILINAGSRQAQELAA